MQIHDFIRVKFPNDNKVYFAEVKEVLPGDELFECRFVHSGSVYTFKKYSGWLEVAETTGAFKPGTRTSDVTLYEETDDHISLGSNVGLTFDDGNSYLGIAEKTDPTLDIKFLHSGNSYSIDYDNIAHRAGGTYDGRKVLVRRTYAPGKSLFSSDVAHAGRTIELPEESTGARILHVELVQLGGPYRITTEQLDSESDVLAWLWQGDPPAGTELKRVEMMLGYSKFDLSGVHQAHWTQLRKTALDWLITAQPESYREFLARREQYKRDHEAGLDAQVPHLGEVTFREVWENFDTWKGLHESEDGWFVWVGYDPAYRPGNVIEMRRVDELDENTKRDIRWYVEQGNPLYQAVQNVMQDQFDMAKMIVIGAMAAGG
jgi:hypothetical protein